MNKNDLIEFLPWIHNLDQKRGMSKYEILKRMNIDTSKHNYRKIAECIDMGFLRQVSNNPPEFVPDREKIWNFWRETPSGLQCKNMIEDHAVVLE
jgi:hypothetical protein